jgi:hypothetical protein
MESERVKLIIYKGKTILIIDISNCRPDEILAAVALAKEVVSRQSPDSIYTITDISETIFNAKDIQAMKDLTQHNKPYVKGAAVVGVSGIRKVAFQIVSNFSQRKFIVCNTVDEAKEKIAELK